MALEDIEVFAEVVQAKSFTQAAKRLSIPTSTASAKVARLEERLGVTLMLRTTRQVSVTPEGKAYYQHCVRALAELAEAERELAEGLAGPSGKLRITAPADLTQSVLAPIVERYLALYPDVSVELIMTNRQVDLVGEGINLAVRVGDLASSNLIARRFFETRAGLWASSEYLERHGKPKTIKDLAKHTMVQMSLSHAELELLDKNNTPVALDFSGRLSTDDMQTSRVFIENGAGIGLLPNFIGINAHENSHLVRVLPSVASTPTTAYFVYPDQRFVSQNVRTFIDCALEQTRREY